MSTKKLTKEDLYKLPAVEIYKLVLEGKILKTFPNGFWQQPEAMNNAIVIIKYLIEDYLKLSDDELKEQLSVKLFRENKLTTMFNKCFNGSPYEVINFAYPNKFKAWEFNVVPNNYWEDKDNIIKATKWLIEDKLKLSDEELKEQLSVNLFSDNGLGGMLNGLNGSPYEIINLVYADKFNPWEFKCTLMGYWYDKENRVKAIKWLIEDKLKLSNDELYTINTKAFKTNGLGGLLSKFFNGSPKKAIQEYLDYYNI